LVSDDFKYFYFAIGFFILFYIPKLVFLIFHFAEDILKLTARIVKYFTTETTVANETAEKISRSKFLSMIGIVVAAIPFVSIFHGIFRGRFNFKVNKETLRFDNLPKSFDGIKVLQFSDMHIGSFYGNEEKIEAAVELMNSQEPDIVLFTGDMVNNSAFELDRFIDILSKIKATIGKYSILGNHDYGEYVAWNSEEEKRKNFESLISKHKECGFNILLNENDTININGENISIIGIENWGLPPFPQYGDFRKAAKGTENSLFKILLSHDPSHWDAEILNKTDIDLTLSGHTHGFQFGIKIPGFHWSPVKYKYPRWSGLYYENNQYLYVNIGLGYIAFPGRVGSPPEIALFELKSTLV
jgi:hypothetical protein